MIAGSQARLEMAGTLARIMYVLYTSPSISKLLPIYASQKRKRHGIKNLEDIEGRLQEFYAHDDTYFSAPVNIDHLVLVTSDLANSCRDNDRVQKDREQVCKFSEELAKATKAIRKAAKVEKRNVQSKFLKALDARLGSIRLLPENVQNDIDFEILVQKLL